jgi:hypothetical protein
MTIGQSKSPIDHLQVDGPSAALRTHSDHNRPGDVVHRTLWGPIDTLIEGNLVISPSIDHFQVDGPSAA